MATVTCIFPFREWATMSFGETCLSLLTGHHLMYSIHVTPIGWFLPRVREKPVHSLPWKNSKGFKNISVTHLTLLKHISWLSFWRVLLWPTPGPSVTHTIASGALRPACRDSGGHVYKWGEPGQPVGFVLYHIPTSPGRVRKIQSREHQPHHITLLVPGTQTLSMICFHTYISVHLWM